MNAITIKDSYFISVILNRTVTALSNKDIIGEYKMVFGLGIDTGGTYTDAVVMDFETGELIASHKSPTTYEDLTIGVKGSMEGLTDEILSKVGVVSLSSTLATNSVVEGRGCRVGLITIGHDYNSKHKADAEVVIGGSHDLLGRETEPLDIKAAEEFFRQIKGKVEGIAISGYLGIRNPAHEIKIRDMAYEILGVRAVCGHELSSTLGFDDRTTTCIMNARLIPVIVELIAAVKTAMAERNIQAPLMIVKGDGSMMSEEEAKIRPIETILSGPASSLIGARKLAGIGDAIVVDIGGTTTDIGILRNGIPALVDYGAVLGDMRTHVKAADISTAGLGGDSHIVITTSGIRISTIRSIPLCVAAKKWPEILETLQSVSMKSPSYNMEFDIDAKNIQDTDFFVVLRKNPGIKLDKEESRFLEFLQVGPRTLAQAARFLNSHPLLFKIDRLENLGLVQRIGLTPTDILHASGNYLEFDPEPSNLAIKHHSRACGMTEEAFISIAKTKVIEKMAKVIFRKVLSAEVGDYRMDNAFEFVVQNAVSCKPARDFSCAITFMKPIIGIGAPAGAYLPEVAKIFGVEAILPKHWEVGNAVGAVTGGIVENVDILIKPSVEFATEESPCIVFAKFGRFEINSITEGIKFARKKGAEYIRNLALDQGAEDVVLSENVDIIKIRTKGMTGEPRILEVKITVTGAGKPKMFQA